MDKVNAVTLFHVGAEFVVIAGVTFWLNRRISGLEEKINILNDTIQKYEETMARQNQLLMRHEQIIRQITGAPPLPTSPPQENGGGPQQPRPQQPRPQQPQTPIATTPREDVPPPQVEESDISDTELDKLLGDELATLKSSKKQKEPRTIEDPIELICEDDHCDLKNSIDQTKIKKRKRSRRRVRT